MAKFFEELIQKYSNMLKPCPHCGAKAEIHLAFGNMYAAFCMSDKCGAMLLYTRTPLPIPLTQFRTLVKRWNKRQDDSEPGSGEWKRMSDLPIEIDDRFECSNCGNVVHYHDRINLYTFNDYCGRCGAYNGFKFKDGDNE